MRSEESWFRVKSRKLITCCLALGVAAASSSLMSAQDTNKMDDRLDAAAKIIQEVMAAPDHAIPETVLGGAHCVVVIPSEKKAAFGVGAQYGQGVASCRTGHG